MLFLASLVLIIVGVVGKLLLDKWKQEPDAILQVKLAVDNQEEEEEASISKLYSSVKSEGNNYYIPVEVMNKYIQRGNLFGELRVWTSPSELFHNLERLHSIQEDNICIRIKLDTEGDSYKVTAIPYGPKADIARKLIQDDLVEIGIRSLTAPLLDDRRVQAIITFDLIKKISS